MSDDDHTASLMTPAKLAQLRKPKPAASPAAWLDQMAAEAGDIHVRHMGELAAVVAQQAQARDDSRVLQALQALAAAAPRLDFTLVQKRSWLDRATGKGKSAGAEFAAQVEQVAAAANSVAATAQEMARANAAGAAPAERTLVEFEVEYRAVEKIIDQGARWLQDMRTQIKARHAAATTEDEQRQVREDAARCELLVGRLKQLRAITTAAQQVHQHAATAAQRRGSVLQQLTAQLAGDAKAWNVRLAPIAASAAESGSTDLSLEGPMETHAELQQSVQRALGGCEQLRTDEAALREALAALRAQLPGA